MISGIEGLGIVPIKTFPEGSNRKTTITKFETVLREETASGSDVEVSDDKKKTSDDNIIYQNPHTGDTYKYIDVSEDKDDDSTEKVTGKKNTTSASEMKKTKYDEYFKKAAKKYNVSESLLKAIAKAESNFNANDVSSAGAIGVMQLMPSTAESLGVKNPYDPEQNIMGGAKCISQKLSEFNGNVRLALAAYNAGSGAVRRNGGVPSYCKSYVNKVLSYKKAFETASAVG